MCAPSLTSSDALLKESCEYRQRQSSFLTNRYPALRTRRRTRRYAGNRFEVLHLPEGECVVRHRQIVLGLEFADDHEFLHESEGGVELDSR